VTKALQASGCPVGRHQARSLMREFSVDAPDQAWGGHHLCVDPAVVIVSWRCNRPVLAQSGGWSKGQRLSGTLVWDVPRLALWRRHRPGSGLEIVTLQGH